MKQNDLLNKETNKVMEDYANKRTATIGYFVFSIAIIMILGISLCVKTAENELYKGKAKNDSLVIKRLNDNLLEPR